MGYEKENIESILNNTGTGKGCCFVNLDILKRYKIKDDIFNFCEIRNLARNKIIPKFARRGWNGKGMFIVYVSGSEVEVKENTPYWNPGLRGKIKIEPHFDMYTA